jgi:nicotinate phosphoribosyltransferase
VILNLKAQGAKIDTWGVGTKLITAADDPALGGVYKVVAKEENGEYLPTIKISGNPEKITTPGFKSVYRIVNRNTGKSEGDYIAMVDEQVEDLPKLKLFDPVHTYMHKFVVDYDAINLLEPVFVNGKQVYELPSLDEIRSYHRSQYSLFWEEYLRKLNPERYPVDLSQKVWDTKMDLIHYYTQK